MSFFQYSGWLVATALLCSGTTQAGDFYVYPAKDQTQQQTQQDERAVRNVHGTLA